MRLVYIALFSLFLFVVLFLGLRGGNSTLEQARDLFKQGEWDQAITLLKNDQTNQPEAFAYLGTLLSLKGKEEEALAYYKKAVDLSPRSTSYLNNVAVTYYSLEQEDEAKEWFLKVQEINPKDSRALSYLKKIEFEEKQNQQMLENLERSLKPKEETFESFLRVGKKYLRIRKWDLAEKYFKKANEKNPKSYEVKALLGRLAYRRFDVEAALSYWLEAQKLKPDTMEPFIEAGRLYAATSKYQQAAFCWNRVNQLAPLGSPEKREAHYYLKSLAPFLSQKRGAP